VLFLQACSQSLNLFLKSVKVSEFRGLFPIIPIRRLKNRVKFIKDGGLSVVVDFLLKKRICNY